MESYTVLDGINLESKIFELTGIRITPGEMYEIIDSCGVDCEDNLDTDLFFLCIKKSVFANEDEKYISTVELGKLYGKGLGKCKLLLSNAN